MRKGAAFRGPSFFRDGEPWFVAADVCAVLELDRQQDSVRYLDDDEKGACLVDTSSGKQSMTVINESGLYSLILRSRKRVPSEILKLLPQGARMALPSNGDPGCRYCRHP